MQVLYQLPPNMMVSSPLQKNQSFIVPQEMTPGGGAKHLPLEQRFPHGTQFFLPQNHGNVTTYMVVSSRDKMSPAVQSPSAITTSGDILKSPPAAGVSQILANVTKTNLVSDIDNPNKLSKNYSSTVWVNKDQLSRKSQVDPMRRPIVQTNDMGHQIHVHKVHHGNARVKYVEFKPVKDGNKAAQSPQQQHQQQHQQQQQQQHGPYTQYYNSQQQNHHRLSVQTHQQQQQQQHSALSPLHSPPALQPPPSIAPRSRANAMNSPPSLVPSPEVRPRFDYQQQQHMRNYTNKSSPLGMAHRMPFVQKYQPNINGSGSKTTILQAFRSIPENVGKTFHHSGSIFFHFSVCVGRIATPIRNQWIW